MTLLTFDPSHARQPSKASALASVVAGLVLNLVMLAFAWAVHLVVGAAP